MYDDKTAQDLFKWQEKNSELLASSDKTPVKGYEKVRQHTHRRTRSTAHRRTHETLAVVCVCACAEQRTGEEEQ
jgi:hypothetical protein